MYCANGQSHGPVSLIYKRQGWCDTCRVEVEGAIIAVCELERDLAVRDVLVAERAPRSPVSFVGTGHERLVPPAVFLGFSIGCFLFAAAILVAVVSL